MIVLLALLRNKMEQNIRSLALTLGTEYRFRDWIYVSSLNAEDANGCQHHIGTNRPVSVWGRSPRNDLMDGRLAVSIRNSIWRKSVFRLAEKLK